MDKNYFKEFAPTIIRSYSRNPNEFWEVSLSPFLNRSPLTTFLKHSRLSLEMLNCFSKVHKQAKDYLSTQNIELGFDAWQWESLKSKEEYFTDAYPIYAFLVIWLYENKLFSVINKFDLILEAVVYGIAGYGILDVIVDSNELNSIELMVTQYFISNYEDRILSVFGKNEINMNILFYIRDFFLKAEIKEKSNRFKRSPYEWGNPTQCGYKAAHLLTPFMLSLNLLEKSHLINSYFDVFFKFGAVIQIIDDYKDLDEDLKIGHYAYMCLEPEIMDQIKNKQDKSQIVEFIKSHKENNMRIYFVCQELIDESNKLLKELGDVFLTKIVTITELRMRQYFINELKLTI